MKYKYKNSKVFKKAIENDGDEEYFIEEMEEMFGPDNPDDLKNYCFCMNCDDENSIYEQSVSIFPKFYHKQNCCSHEYFTHFETVAPPDLKLCFEGSGSYYKWDRPHTYLEKENPLRITPSQMREELLKLGLTEVEETEL